LIVIVIIEAFYGLGVEWTCPARAMNNVASQEFGAFSGNQASTAVYGEREDDPREGEGMRSPEIVEI
jgi:hypothetical protein